MKKNSILSPMVSLPPTEEVKPPGGQGFFVFPTGLGMQMVSCGCLLMGHPLLSILQPSGEASSSATWASLGTGICHWANLAGAMSTNLA